MATIKEIKISRNCGKRPTDNLIYCGYNWRIEKGEPYDLVQFSINELKKPYYWNESLCVRCGTSEDEIEKLAEEYASEITDGEIKLFKEFLEFGEEYGFD